jgi:hypothetical protein
MGVFFLILGVLIILFTVYDMSITVLGSQGAGIYTDFLTKYIWKLFLRIANFNGNSPVLKYAGTIIVIIIMANWIIWLWIGTSFIFLSHDNIIVETNTGEPASISGVIYFSGYILATLGNGDLKPQGEIWRLITNILSFSGLVFITMTVSYLMNVLAGDTQKRKLSRTLLVLGNTPSKMAKNLLDKRFMKSMDSYLTLLGDDIFSLSKYLESYPILHYYHASSYSEALNLNLTVLDEALSLIICSNKKKKMLKWPLLNYLRKSITSYIQTQQKHLTVLDSEIPTVHHIREINLMNIGSFEESQVFQNYGKIENRRKILQSLLRQSGYGWDDVFTPKPKNKEFE